MHLRADHPAHPALAPLRWRELPLDGRVLIEASAGTGKTWNIGLVYLRLLIERGLGVDRILVTTFTEAAAQELRERLRRRIIEAEQWLQRPDDLASAAAQAAATGDPDSLPAWLFAQSGEPGRAKEILRRVQLARADFDRAPVSTIHSLCQRIQRDYPLEAGAAFRSERLVDEADLLRECVEDFWRRRYLEGEVDPCEYGLLGGGPESLLRDLLAIAGCGADNLLAVNGLDALPDALSALCQSGVADELRALAQDKSQYGARKTKFANALRAVAELVDSRLDPAAFQQALADELDGRFDDDAIDEQQPAEPPLRLRDHPLIRRLQGLRAILANCDRLARGRVLAAASEYCRAEMRSRAQRRNVQTYSMLIDGVHARLCGDAADTRLADRLHEAFPAALIDEFQDTDQRQYAIFDRIYRGTDGVPRGTLVMIGDPKQAIYGFRGGDIAAYLRAAAQTHERYSLATNHRSASALVGALNGLYGAGGGFGHAGIGYQPVSAGSRADSAPWTCEGMAVAAPFVVHAFRGDAVDDKGRPLDGLGALEDLALEDCADRIAAQLMDPRQCIGGRRLLPGDVAVLVPTNAQVRALRERLVLRRVPCVGAGRGSVFEGEVAQDLERVLAGVLAADDEGAVRGALSTRLLGAGFAEFEAWRADAEAFERELERFARWRVLARSRGVLAVVGELVAVYGATLLASPTGERSLTDLRHLGELLAERQPQEQGLEGLLAWLATMRCAGGDGEQDAEDARQLRIESDAGRVQLMTVHAAKGLEFPIVYLPLAWRIASRKGQHAPKVLRFHDDEGGLCVDVGSAGYAAHLAQHHREDLDERLRLLYVAMTRAVHALHVYWVQRKDFHADGAPTDARACEVAAIDLLVAHAQLRLGLVPGEAALPGLAARLAGVAVATARDGGRTIYEAPTPPRREYAIQAPPPALRAFEWQHSFSAIARGATAATAIEAGAADEGGDGEASLALAPEGNDPRLLALQPLRGPRFGDAVHGMFEHAAPGPLWPAQRGLVVRELMARALRVASTSDADIVEEVARMVDRSRRTDLGEGLRLADVGVEARVSEFEFQLPLRHVSVARMRALCEAHGHADAVPATLDAQRLNGMLAGFVDLVFEWRGRYHVLDYKTNWLGADVAGYRGAGLEAAMRAHHYPLQALLYSVAVHRYLGQRLHDYEPARHLGESWYLFVRALGLAPTAGVWRRRWPPALIVALDELFAGAAEHAA